MPLISCDGAPPPLLMVVEYLESSMSNDLLYKFPDNSAFDFNYAQSSIWSPLLPRAAPPGSDGGVVSRKLTYEEVGLLENTKKIAGKIKRKFTDAVLNNVSRCIKMKRRRRRSFRFSPVAPPRRHPSPSPKGLAKVMKGAANHFKKRMKKSSNLDFDHS
ncbi:hypothetical protein SASPL_113841 [Salvia splendens]|uniref:Uncharacterized protein n=1 Tax=Salvia splendens TaxID=180675 RepID=A0A8X8Y0R6_SALSN|nr:uncharacterized protein LOC121803340 [Salvia splendens]KAG6423445.1 hypothetical protein SASPL_113841 [Salvia splendens]